MATVTKDFKVKHGIKVQGDANIDASLYVGGPNATVNGSDIITEDIITGGTQTNIAVTYNPTTKTLDFIAENGVADSTTDDLDEGQTNLYFTEQRAIDAGDGVFDAYGSAGIVQTNLNNHAQDTSVHGVTGDVVGTTDSQSLSNKTFNGVVFFQSAGGAGGTNNHIDVDSNTGKLAIESGYGLDVKAQNNVTVTSLGGDIVLNPDGDVYLGSVASGNAVTTKSDIDALTTSDIEEGSNLYFTNQRAIEAVGGAATSQNTPNSIVLRDTTGSFAAEDITASELTANRLNFANGSGSIDTNTVGMNIFAASGDVNIGAMQGQVNIGGSQVTTAANTQTLTNKTIGDVLTFNDGSNDSTIDVAGNNLNVTANGTLSLTSLAGDIVIAPDVLSEVGKAYIGSTTAGNEIATHSYVDNAVTGLSWKTSVHLLWDDTAAVLGGASGTLVIDGHPALTASNNGYRILVTNIGAPGIFEYVDDGNAWTLIRTADADAPEELVGAAVFVMEGTQYNATSWIQSNHYLTNFTQQTWTQFSGTGNYTAGFGINLVGREFSADTTEMATTQALTDAVGNLTDYVDGFLNSNDGTVIAYIDQQDSATLLAANGYSDTLVAAGDATAVPQYLAINVNDVARQVAATSSAFATLPSVAYAFPKADFRSAKFLVKLAYGTHTEVSEVLLTLDTSDNVAITEYAIVGTNGSMSTISAEVDGPVVNLLVTPVNDSAITVVGTLII